MNISRKYLLLIVFVCVVYADNNAVTDAPNAPEDTEVPDLTTKSATTKAPETTTTLKPKVNVQNSNLCKICSCNYNERILDCSKRKWTTWFGQDDWNTITNGDFVFETLRLDYNNLTEVIQLPENQFKNIYLGFNQIAKIADSAFLNTPLIEKLDLSHNQLQSKMLFPNIFRGQFVNGDFEPLPNLKEINLGHNELHTLDQDLFEHTSHLETLILCKNQFQVIDSLVEKAIASLNSLKTLDLAYNELDALPMHLLNGPRDLEKLILTGNLMPRLPDKMNLAINLKYLLLDENLMRNFSADNIFPEMKSLEYLSISNMPDLEFVGEGAFKNLQNLKTLIMDGNPKLTYFDAKAFVKPTDNPKYPSYPTLTELYLNNNQLSALDHDLLQRWDLMKIVDLRYNPWICNCTNHWIVDILLPQIKTTNEELTNNVICSGPEDLNRLPLLDAVVDQKLKHCVHESSGNGGGGTSVWAVILISFLVAIPIGFLAFFAYKRECFGLINLRGRRESRRALYTRSFDDDFHI